MIDLLPRVDSLDLNGAYLSPASRARQFITHVPRANALGYTLSSASRTTCVQLTSQYESFIGPHLPAFEHVECSRSKRETGKVNGKT
jgi:hypothetical protein